MLTLEADMLDQEEHERRKRTIFFVWFFALFSVLLVMLFWLFGVGGLPKIIAQENGAAPKQEVAGQAQNSAHTLPGRGAKLIIVFVEPGDEPWFGTMPVASLPCIRYAGAECNTNGDHNHGANGSHAGASHEAGGENGENGEGGNARVAFAFDGGWYGGGGLPSYVPPTNDGSVPPGGNPPPANVDQGGGNDGSVVEGPTSRTTPVDDTAISNPGEKLPDIVARDYPSYSPSAPSTPSTPGNHRRMPHFERNNGGDDDTDNDIGTGPGTGPGNGPGEGPGDGPGNGPAADTPSDTKDIDPIFGPRDALIFDPPLRDDGTEPTDVPEPGSMLLLGSGLFALSAFRRRKRA